MFDHLAFAPYGWFIWPSFAVFAILIGGITAATLISARRTRRRLAALEGRDR